MSFTWPPSYGSSKKTKSRINRAQFGDGYMQRTGDGINNMDGEWSLRFNNVTPAVADAIEAYLIAAGKTGASFNWVPPFSNPTAATVRVMCDEWDVVPDTFGAYSVTATFKRVYGE